MRTLYVAICDGEPIYAAYNSTEVTSYCASHMQGEIEDMAEEIGRDIEELDEKEVAELAFMAGHSGDYAYPARVTFNEKDDDDTMVTAVSLNDGSEDEIRLGDIKELL